MANPTNLNQYPRGLSDLEFSFYQKTFPHIVRSEIVVLGPKDQRYNCISYSLGFTDRWIDVGDSKTGLATMYAHYYYEGCGTAQAAIDVYAQGETPKHAAKVEISSCASKMQVQALLRHPRQALEDGGYGDIYGHFAKNAAHPGNGSPQMPQPDHPNNHELPPPLPVGHPSGNPPIPVVYPQPPTTLRPHPPAPAPAAPHGAPHPPAPHAPAPRAPAPAPHAPTSRSPSPAPHGAPSHPTGSGRPAHSGNGFTRMAVKKMGPYEPIPPPADEAVATAHQVYSSLKDSYPPAVSNFETLFAAWKATWNTPEMQLEPNSSARATGPAFYALVKLGPDIIPLVVKKLAEPGNGFAIHLYNTLEEDEEAKVDPGSVLDNNVVQRHANLIVDMNHARAQGFKAKADEWAQHQEDNSLSANSADYVSGDAYNSMVKMGPSVIGHALEKYAQEPSGWWHEMLHEIVHGQKGGPGTFFKDRLHQDWKDWFEKGLSHAEAPKAGSTAPAGTT